MILKKNTAQTIYLPGLISQLTGELQANPTLAAADCFYSLDGGAFTALGTTPDVHPAGGTQIRVQLTAAETNGSILTLRFSDALGDEWDDLSITIQLFDNVEIPTALDIDTQLSSVHGAGLWTNTGSGSTSFLYIVTNPATGNPLDSVLVEVYTDVHLTNKVAAGITDNFGQVTFHLDPGTYYFVSTHAGYTFANPDVEVVG